MATTKKRSPVYKRSPDVVARDIQGQLILVPLVAGVGDVDDDLFTLNPTGRAIWELLDGKRSLRDIARQLSETYAGSAAAIEKDVVGLVGELHKRKMLKEVSA